MMPDNIEGPKPEAAPKQSGVPPIPPAQPANQAPPSTPPPATPPTMPASPASPAPAAAPATDQPKKGNSGLVIVIIILVILAVLGVGAYFVVHYFSTKAKNALEGAVKTQTDSLTQGLGNSLASAVPGASGIASATTSGVGAVIGEKSGSDYATVVEKSPTGAFPILVNDEIKPVVASVFGGAKIDQWSTVDENSVYISYVTKNNVSSSDSSKIESALTAKGFQTEAVQSSSEGIIVNMSKADYQVSVTNIASPSSNGITVIATKK